MKKIDAKIESKRMQLQVWYLHQNLHWKKERKKILNTKGSDANQGEFNSGVIHKLQIGNAFDLENIIRFLKPNPMVLVIHIVEILKYISSHGFPSSRTSNIIHPIYKVGNLLDLKNYRMIMVSHILAKLFSMTLDEFMYSFVEINLHAPSQASFHINYRTIDHILNLWAIIEKAWVNKQNIYYCFVIFYKAFVTNPRHLLFQILDNLGIPEDVISLIMIFNEQWVGQV